MSVVSQESLRSLSLLSSELLSMPRVSNKAWSRFCARQQPRKFLVLLCRFEHVQYELPCLGIYIDNVPVLE